ncbi:MAG: porin, partial [Gammaproteobacteria bacterium]|nr:porin [Gammaproteobacteria bacterium]
GDNLGEIMSGAADMKFGDLSFALAYQDVDTTGTAAKVVVGYKLGNTSIGITAENIEPEVGSIDTTNFMVSAKHKISDSNTIKLTYAVEEEPTVGIEDPTMMAVGIDHKLNDTTTAFAYWADGADGGLSADAKLVGDATVVAAGVIVKF